MGERASTFRRAEPTRQRVIAARGDAHRGRERGQRQAEQTEQHRDGGADDSSPANRERGRHDEDGGDDGEGRRPQHRGADTLTDYPLSPLMTTPRTIHFWPARNTARMGSTLTTVYDAVGRQVASVDALGRRSTSLYDSVGRLSAAVNALGTPPVSSTTCAAARSPASMRAATGRAASSTPWGGRRRRSTS